MRHKIQAFGKMVHNNSTSCHFSPGKRRLFTSFHPFLNDILHPYIKSYTLSYTRKCQSVKYFSVPGVGNVGYFHKTFFGKKGEAFNENSPMFLFSGKRPSSNSPVIRRTGTQFFSFSYVNPRHLWIQRKSSTNFVALNNMHATKKSQTKWEAKYFLMDFVVFFSTLINLAPWIL